MSNRWCRNLSRIGGLPARSYKYSSEFGPTVEKDIDMHSGSMNAVHGVPASPSVAGFPHRSESAIECRQLASTVRLASVDPLQTALLRPGWYSISKPSLTVVVTGLMEPTEGDETPSASPASFGNERGDPCFV